MISPPVTAWPAKTFTPRRLALESRPLRLEPRPFLCAISALLLVVLRGLRARAAGDLGDLDAGQLLTVARPALVAPLGLELEDAQLGAALVSDDLRLDLDLAQVGRSEDGLVAVGEQERLELDLRALVA